MSAPKPDDTIVVDFTVSNPTTGAASNADSLPTGILVRNGTDTGESVTISNKATGVYKASVAIPSGYASGDVVQVRISATVGGVSGSAVIWSGIVDTKRNSDLNDVANITVTPVTSTVSTGEVVSENVVAYQYSAYSFTFTIVDGDGNAIDLSGKDIQFVVADPNGTLEYVLSGASVSIGGASNNQVTVTATDTRTQTAGVYQYFLRNQTDDTMLAVGSLEIHKATDIE